MEDGRLARGQCQLEVPAQVGQLGRHGAERPVEVESGLADGDDTRIPSRLHEPRPGLVVDPGGFVGMDPDGGGEPRQPGREGDGLLPRRAVPAWDEDTLEARQAGRAEHEVCVGVEPIGLDVAVAVDEAHGMGAW